ncbi:MAG: HAD hydrolase family protein [Chloroflexota bacterium]
MAQSYLKINSRLARRIRLVMTDVDGTMTAGDGAISPLAADAIGRLEAQGVTVGLVSGRNMSRLELFAGHLGISGPLVGENGGVAKMSLSSGEPLELGYSQLPAVKALEKLKGCFPDGIEERDWNKDRAVDVVFRLHGVDVETAKKCLVAVDLLDSGFVLHLVQKGVNKGATLLRVLEKIGGGDLSPDQVLVLGDSGTDMSLFQAFRNSVLIPNPGLPAELTETLRGAASYESAVPFGDGFAQVVYHILDARLEGAAQP